MLQVNAVPEGTFSGSNFMTPQWLAYYRTTYRGKTVYVELSKGRGLGDGPIYGVTFRYPGGGELWQNGGKDPSTCFRSKEEALEYIRGGGRTVCPNCGQWQDPDCLNACKARNLA